jgi:thiamine monophosphate kinase
VFTASVSKRDAIEAIAAQLDLRLTRVGRILPEQGLHILSHGQPMQLAHLGFDHFGA